MPSDVAPTPADLRPAAVPRIVFNRFIPTARYPQRADRSAAGSLPTLLRLPADGLQPALGWQRDPLDLSRR